MNKSENGRRYKWSDSATNLLVSIWCHESVQNQLKSLTRIQPIWESIARCMRKKGYSVTGLQCRTRIKNMLCIYHESIRKNDPSNARHPYHDVFKKVLEKKISKKKDLKSSQVRQFTYSKETAEENGISLDSNNFKLEPTQHTTNYDAQEVEFLKLSNDDSQDSLNFIKEIKKITNIFIKAINTQRKAIMNSINMQSQMIEKLLIVEREKLEILLKSDSENRRQVEMRLEKLLSNFSVNIVPQTM